jgi:hypothetical protein
MVMLRDLDVKERLPQVLIDLVDTHTDDFRNTENVEEVIWLLAPVDAWEPDSRHPEMPQLNIDKGYLATEKAKLFASFSEKQAAAIAFWLQSAIEWGDLALRRDQVASALRYWTHKAKG